MEEEQITETIQVTGKYPCRKCLLREMDKNAYMENLYAYIAGSKRIVKQIRRSMKTALLYVRNVNI